MSATLRQVVSRGYGKSNAPAGSTFSPERRGGYERRASDRRRNLLPFESRDARLRFAAQAAGFGTYYLDCATGDSLWSAELKAIAGLSVDSMPLSTEEAESLIHPDDRQAFFDKLLASLDPAGSGRFEDEHRIVRPDGDIRWVRSKGQTFFAGERESRFPLAATGIVMDITASRMAEQGIREGREELEQLLNSAIDAVVTVDSNQRIVRFNPSAARIFHCRPEDAIGSPLERFIPERFRVSHQKHVTAFANGGTTARTMGQAGFFFGLRADGEEFPIEASIAKVQVGDRRSMTVFLRDVTDRMQAQEALHRSKEVLELAIRGAGIGTWHCDLQTGQVEASARCRQLFGLPLDEPLDIERIFSAVHPDDRPDLEPELRRAFEEGGEYQCEKRFVWPDGDVRWLLCIGRKLDDEVGGKSIGMRGISIDITERKRRDEVLRRSKADLDLALQAGCIGIWNWDTGTGKVEWSERQYQLFSIPLGEPITYERFMAVVHPDDRPAVLAAERRSVDQHEDYSVEYRVVWPDRSIHWILGRGRIVGETGNGQSMVVRGVNIDITHRKQREEALAERTEELQAVLDAIPAAVLICDDAQCRMIRCNPAGNRIFSSHCGDNVSYSAAMPERAVDYKVFDADGRELQPDELVMQRAASLGQAIRAAEYRLDFRDGRQVWLYGHATPLYYHDGAVRGVVAVFSDITERKQAEQQIRASEIRFHSTFDQMAVGLAHVSQEGLLQRVNAKFAAITGYDRQTLERMSFQEITHPDDLQADLDYVAKLLAGSISGYTMEKRYIRKDGTAIWCNLTVSLVRTAAGEPDYFVSVVEDIQARKEAEAALAEERDARHRLLATQVAERTTELAHSNEALLRSNMELSNFAHVAAHDLQTPLRSIAGFAQLLQSSAGGKLAGEELEWLKLIVGNTRRLQELIHRLLAYSRLDAQARAYEETDLQELLNQVISALNGPIKESGAIVSCSGLPTLAVDRTQVAQLFQNLIENALKYRSDKPLCLSISSRRQGGEWIFSVADNGIGIDPKHHRRIFEIFRRLHSYAEIPGTGIGLAICQRIVSRHGGHMWVESEKGKGSIFRFSLPAASPKA